MKKSMPKRRTQLKPIIELAETLSGHWYKIGKIYVPSSTTILNAYPQSVQLTQWIAQQGWHESQRIKSEAGERGTRVHQGIEYLLQKSVLDKENYSLEEWSRLSAFVDWYKAYHPQIVATEKLCYSRKYGYAGRTDAIFKISDQIIVCDWKTSSSIHDHFPLQVASYAQALEEQKEYGVAQTAILQLGAKNKSNYRFVLYPDWRDHFKTFLAVKKVWEHDIGWSKDYEPPILNLPLELKL